MPDGTGPTAPNTPDGAPKVAIRGVSRRYGAVYANRDIDLDIRSGEFLTLLGPSGCGKTTLMRIVAGLETCDSGRVLIDGRDVTHVPPRDRGLGMVFQSYALFPHMSVFENVAYGLRARRTDAATIERRVREMLALVSLESLGDRRPAALSGGQQQRVALARALATRPSLLMLDEPLAALDLKLRRQLQLELKRIHRETGVTFLFVTHDQEEALFLSDRIAVMRDARIEQLDTPANVYARPVNAWVADFVGDVTLLDAVADADGIRLTGWPETPRLPIAPTPERGAFRLAVRPEHVVPADDTEPALTATLDQCVNEGSTTLAVLHAGDVVLRARVLGRPDPAWSPGARVRLRITGDAGRFTA